MQRLFLAVFFVVLPIAAMSQPDLSGTVPILDETFEGHLNRYDGKSGVWSTLPRRGQLQTNAAEAVFLDFGVLGGEVDATLPAVHAITAQGLALRTVALPDSAKPALRSYMQATGQGKQAENILYATGQITTSHTWSQTYGYFEIEARIPRGQGRWPAFWLTFAGIGWPPEIDIFEAYGSGLEESTKKDQRFNTAVLFDTLDSDLQPTHSVEIENTFASSPEGRRASVKSRGKVEVHTFSRHHYADRELDADIYDDFHVYAALWTPETITFFFGKDRDSLREIYRVPTPEDVNDPMFIVANDQFTARGGILPAKASELVRVLRPENAFMVKRISVRALPPTIELRMSGGANPYDPGDSLVFDTPGDDEITPGEGFDIITLTGGADRLYLTRGRANKIISGFGKDDLLTLEGYPFTGAADALSRLTQVGDDVWLPSGADPAWPHTVIFRGTEVAAFDTAQFDVRWSVGLDIWLANASRADTPETDSDGDGLLTTDLVGGWLNDRGKPVQMTGTIGPDRFIVAHSKTTVIEPADGDADTLITWVNIALPANIERGIARGREIALQGSKGNDRLEADNASVQLEGGAGDDLYVFTPKATETTVRIGSGDGHDRLRGFREGDRIALAPDLKSNRALWTIEDVSAGVLVRFGPDQTLLIEDNNRDAIARVLNIQ